MRHFEVGFADDIEPSAGDVVVSVRGDDVSLGHHSDDPAPTDLRVIGFLNGAPVWAGTAASEAAGLRPWAVAAHTVEPPYGRIIARGLYDVRWRSTHRFCGECGGLLDECPGFPTRRCPRCSTIPYVPQAITPAVVMAIRSGERLLLARHSYGLAQSIWALVAGYVEAGESLEHAVAREVHEEVGLDVGGIRYRGSEAYSLDSPSALMLMFTATCGLDAQPQVDGVELASARWFSRDEIRALSPDQLPPRYAIATRLIDAFLAEEMMAS